MNTRLRRVRRHPHQQTLRGETRRRRNHNICIYYPHTVGGGYKALFRKVGNQASKYYPPPASDSDKPYTLVRRNTSFIYEDFMSTGGTDVKVYTVGPNYAHAEAKVSRGGRSRAATRTSKEDASRSFSPR